MSRNIHDSLLLVLVVVVLVYNLYYNAKYVVWYFHYLNSMLFYFNPQLNDMYLTIVIWFYLGCVEVNCSVMLSYIRIFSLFRQSKFHLKDYVSLNGYNENIHKCKCTSKVYSYVRLSGDEKLHFSPLKLLFLKFCLPRVILPWTLLHFITFISCEIYDINSISLDLVHVEM